MGLKQKGETWAALYFSGLLSCSAERINAEQKLEALLGYWHSLQDRDCGGLDKGSWDEGAKKWEESGYIFEVSLVGPVGILDIE